MPAKKPATKNLTADKAMKMYIREFAETAVDILGAGYTPDYYEQTIISQLRWAFTEGFRRGAESKEN